MNDLFIVIVVLIGGTGATFLFVGKLIAVVTTAGLNKYWGFASILFPPIAIVYCLMHIDQAKYPLKLMATGLAILSGLLIFLLLIKYVLT